MAPTLLNASVAQRQIPMKSTLTHVSILAVAAALSSATAFGQARPNSAAQRAYTSSTPTATEAGQTQMEGRIVTLFHYLSGSTTMGTTESSAATSTSPAITSRQTTTTGGQPFSGASSSTAPRAANSAPAGAWAAGGASAGQPLAFIAEGAGSSSRSATSSSTTSSSSTSPSTSSSSEPRSTTTSLTGTSGDVYVLVFDPNNESSRTAFARAQWMVSGGARSTAYSSTTSPSDRLNVSGREDQDRSSTTSANHTDREHSSSSPAASAYTGSHWMGGKQVKITGKVLDRAGVKALEIASIEDATPASSTTTAPSTTTTPSSSDTTDQNRDTDTKDRSK